MDNDNLSDADFALAHALLRIGLGLNFFMHGFSRLFTLTAFVAHMRTMFAATWLHGSLTTFSAYAIPLFELFLGAVLILGVLLRPTLVAGCLLLFLLTFGVGVAQNWNAASEQLIYLIAFALLLAGARHHRFGLDRLLT